MESPIQVLDRARALCGTDAELARRIGIPRQHVANMRAGTRAISPETMGLVCAVLKLDGDYARQLVAMTIITNPKNSKTAERLRHALFTTWVLGVACALQIAPKDSQASRSLNELGHATYETSSRISGTDINIPGDLNQPA